MLTVVCGIARDEAGLYLVGQRPRSVSYAGHWEFPGGKVEPEERHDQALQREWREELDTSIEILRHDSTLFFPEHEPPFELRTYEIFLLEQPRLRYHAALWWVYPPLLSEYPLTPGMSRWLESKKWTDAGV